ncbi:hypothetical protein ORI20_32210 [Mycobacterium sp. CVI_P3]|uniref:Uncharacterized protein n=1 Tax=Mycobacterium pinniadriaticum TaxID=2994102 RepID=A0ABT3SPB7_9MYCO|nr:hypothetical protein [Mycobacterium pinniadriaticum]MCX2934929.1 hypothetical protein [Mycobacterium pinniadriaticum]MCX2941356.1 hypothetical protein [Mycobacterium pinniadriaticum]
MAENTLSAGAFDEALRRLDQDIAEAERRLAQLRAMRESIQPFIDQYVVSGSVDELEGRQVTGGEPEPAQKISLTDAVVQVFESHPDQVLLVDDVLKELGRDDEARDATRNAIHYAVRLGKVSKEGRRGRYILRSTSTPVAAGVEVNGELTSSSSREEGEGRDDTSTLLHDHDGGTRSVPNPFDRDRAPIGGLTAASGFA